MKLAALTALLLGAVLPLVEPALAQQAPAFPTPQAVAPAPSAQGEALPKELWFYAGMKGGAMGWEVMSARRNTATDSAYIARFLYHSTPQTIQDIRYTVVVQKFEFECATGRYLLGEGLYLDDQLQQVAASRPLDQWTDIPKGSAEDILMQIACTGAEVGNQREAGNLAEAVAGARTLAIP